MVTDEGEFDKLNYSYEGKKINNHPQFRKKNEPQYFDKTKN